MSQTAKCSMGRCMRVTANNRHTWQDQTLLRTDHVQNSLTGIIDSKFSNIKLGAIIVQSDNLQA